MPVTDITKNTDDNSITITAEFEAPLARVWQLYADPRQLERVWGPPTHPATFVEHELRPGSRTTYYMTGPEGEKYAGYWRITEVDEPNSFTFADGFADPEDFSPNTDLPESQNVYRFESTADGTRVTFLSSYATKEALEQVLAMGMEEGATQAINQIDAFLAQ
ncbi:uncharacterized protein YndB with AHSA1/START domain [Propionibacteriaceae bacterium ES.041]|uniref:SRPBCC family protein n=1 Tax=Enemella evansiae TaxID=2016499 RepID=UPI000B965780|nr:SRPBCC domain-containing protein [Enemella evansiae]OYN96160.1 polyketide cyclase [Enemella evansiae]PFG65382.1 uncharacterized protein YndB with AHSA1/START domain [Propionibacteriaceae bacterium ES.041]